MPEQKPTNSELLAFMCERFPEIVRQAIDMWKTEKEPK